MIVMDLPGYWERVKGKVADTIPGMAAQTVEIIKALGYDKINLLGLSMGGIVAQEIVRLEGNLVNRLFLQEQALVLA